MTLLLVHPPVCKPCEPPPGLARICGALKARGIEHYLLDANMEGLLDLLSLPLHPQDTWTRRALKNKQEHISRLRSRAAMENFDRYARAVQDINRLLAAQAKKFGAQLTLGDYAEPERRPVRSRDLLQAAEEPEKNVFYPYFSKRLAQLCSDLNPLVIGFSINFLSQALTASAMLGFLRREGCRAKIVLGGGLITSWSCRPGLPAAFAGLADHLIAGPGETQLLELAGCTAASKSYALPDYSGFPFDDYLAPARILPFSTASGCYWGKCRFCPEQAEGSAYAPLAPALASAQARELVALYRPGLVHFVDNALSPAFLKKIIERPPGAPWYGFARVSPELQDEAFCGKLRASGCVMLQLGLESGDNAVLSALHKGITVEESSRALQALKRAGIGTYVYLLFGTPAETEQSARRTLDFTERESAHIDFLNLAVFNMPVESADAEALGTGAFFEGDLALYTAFKHPGAWDRGRVRRFLDREFKREPAIAAILRRDPPFFTSSHAPFSYRINRSDHFRSTKPK